MTVFHTPVMVREVVASLKCRSGAVYVDGTVGGGGHAEAILLATAPDGLLIGIDADAEALREAEQRLSVFGARKILTQGNFADMERILAERNIREVDGILLDLGVSSHQLDTAERGFSFSMDAPLDMRMDMTKGRSAYDLLHTLTREELERILHDHGEERMARRIAQAIIETRKRAPIRTTAELAAVVLMALPNRTGHWKIHPATRTFQALRIAVNDELTRLKQAIAIGIKLLKAGGHFSVISFHSLEDRIVKDAFHAGEKGCICPPDLPLCACGLKPALKVLTRKPNTPSAAEIHENPRSRSAKLRTAERIWSWKR